MATIPIKFGVGSTGLRVSYTPVEAITGGQLVEARAVSSNPGQRACGVAASGSLLVVGVAVHDIRAAAAYTGDRAVVGKEHALTVVNFAIVPVTFQGTATRGVALIAGSVAGTVAAAGATPDARTVVGTCVSDSVADGAVGLALIART